MQRLFETNLSGGMKRLAAGDVGGFLASAAIIFALFLGEVVAVEGAYAGLGNAAALLAILGSAASAGYLAFVVSSLFDADSGLWKVGAFSSRSSLSDAGTSGGEDWPLLVTLLFGGVTVLFAGLAGWVELRA